MKILQVYTHSRQAHEYRVDLRVKGKRIRRRYPTYDDALKGAEVLRAEGESSLHFIIPPPDEIQYGWAKSPSELPSMAGVYMIVPRPFLDDLLYVGTSANVRSRLMQRTHKWWEIIKDYPNAWITYWKIDQRTMRYSFELQLIKRYAPKYQGPDPLG